MHRQHKRKHELYKKKLEANPKSKQSTRELEETNRSTALARPIEENNKGYMLLQKMISRGSDQAGDLASLVGERQPIQVEVKTDRRGVGHVSKRQRGERRERGQEARRQSELQRIESHFRTHSKRKKDRELAQRDFHRCQVVCRNFDQGQDRDEPSVPWYWPVTPADEDQDSAPLDPDSLADRLAQLNSHIRSQYLYCIWCGIHFDDDEDMAQNCPGDTRLLHDRDG